MLIIATMTKITNVNTKRKFEVDGRCMDCMFKGFERLMTKSPMKYDDRQEFFQTFNHTIAQNYEQSIPEIHRTLSNKFSQITGIEDLYADEKSQSNELALVLYLKYKTKVVESLQPFKLALRLSIAGNIMDYGPGSEFNVHNTIEEVLHSEFAIDKSSELENRIKQAKKILYIRDNAGEIVFDKLFIETLNHSDLTFAVRGGAALNDVLLADAEQVGLTKVCSVISNGYNASSTILKFCSEEFLKIYNDADLIISKGQGNLEGLIDENDSRIFFLLMVKCEVMAERLEVEKGSFVVYQSN